MNDSEPIALNVHSVETVLKSKSRTRAANDSNTELQTISKKIQKESRMDAEFETSDED